MVKNDRYMYYRVTCKGSRSEGRKDFCMQITEINSVRNAQKALYRNIKNGASKVAVTAENSIGITMMNDGMRGNMYAVKAVYKSKSTEPYCVRVISNHAGEHRAYDVDIRKVKPKNASMMEMFALCCFADDHHVSEGSAFGSFRELKNYVTLDRQSIGCAAFSYEDFLGTQMNWYETINRMKNLFLEDGLFYQYQSCLQLMDIFDYAMYFSMDELGEDTFLSETIIDRWKQEAKKYVDTRDAVSQLMKEELFR